MGEPAEQKPPYTRNGRYHPADKLGSLVIDEVPDGWHLTVSDVRGMQKEEFRDYCDELIREAATPYFERFFGERANDAGLVLQEFVLDVSSHPFSSLSQHRTVHAFAGVTPAYGMVGAYSTGTHLNYWDPEQLRYRPLGDVAERTIGNPKSVGRIRGHGAGLAMGLSDDASYAKQSNDRRAVFLLDRSLSVDEIVELLRSMKSA